MKLHLNSTQYYLLKVIFFFLLTILIYFHFGSIHGTGNKLSNNGLVNVTVAGVKSIYSSGIYFFIFTLVLFVANPKLNLMLESAVIAAIIQFLFFTLTVYEAINLNFFIIEMLLTIAIASVLIDNLYSRKIKGPRIGFTIAFSVVYGIWMANYFIYSGLSPESNIETLLAANIGIFSAQITIILLVFLLLGKLLANNKNYRSLVVIPLSIISFLVIGLWVLRQIM